jgi:hypothetical protein
VAKKKLTSMVSFAQRRRAGTAVIAKQSAKKKNFGLYHNGLINVKIDLQYHADVLGALLYTWDWCRTST